jgi:polar amino acid transport system ATP-binding protein
MIQGAPIIQFQDVVLGYDGKIIVNHLNLTINDLLIQGSIKGQSICFLSRSGRGKSTLFKALSGLLEPMSGNILVQHKDGYVKTREGLIGFVDQAYTLFRHKTVRESLIYSMRKLSLTIREKEAKVDQELASWYLTGVKDKYPKELSGGQKQRVAIMEKLLASNHYIIMDEPISGLDVVAIDQVKLNFKHILSSHEKNTILFSTHDLGFALEMADIIYVLGLPSISDDFSIILKTYDMWKANKYPIEQEIRDLLARS